MTNTVTLCGFLGQDAKTGKTKSGDDWASVNIGVTKIWKETQNTIWVGVSAFRKSAQDLARAKKGDMIMLEGELSQREWEKDGVKHSTLQVIARNFVIKPKVEAEESAAEAFDGI